MTITHTQIPNGTILNVLDSSGKQLYSPYDTNGNQIKTKCTVTMGEENILPLPANYLTETNYIDFEPGIYTWQLKYFGDEYYNEYSIPFIVEIRDFELVKVLNPEIFPNEDILVKFLTPIGTEVDIDDVTNDDELGLITNVADDNDRYIYYIDHWAIDRSVGEHSVIFNQEKNYIINYTIKDPLIYQVNPTVGEYSTYITIDTMISQESSIEFNGETYVTINDIHYPITSRSSGIKTDTVLANHFPPGTYNIKSTAILDDDYQDTGYLSFTITTEKCTIDLTSTNNILSEQNPSITLTSNYLYETIGIQDANIALVDTNTNTIIDTQTTTNGITTWTIDTAGTYQVVAIDVDETWLLSSDIINIRDDESKDYIKDIDINNQANLLVTMNKTEHPENENLVNTISINSDGNLILTIDVGNSDSPQDIYIDKDGDLKYE